MNEELKSYIESELSSGVSEEEIRNTLMQQGGWTTADLDNVFGKPDKPIEQKQNTVPPVENTIQEPSHRATDYVKPNTHKNKNVMFIVLIVLVLTILSATAFVIFNRTYVEDVIVADDNNLLIENPDNNNIQDDTSPVIETNDSGYELLFKNVTTLQGMSEEIKIFQGGAFTYQNNMPFNNKISNGSGTLNAVEYGEFLNFLNTTGIIHMKITQSSETDLICEGGRSQEIWLNSKHNQLRVPCVSGNTQETNNVTETMSAITLFLVEIINQS